MVDGEACCSSDHPVVGDLHRRVGAVVAYPVVDVGLPGVNDRKEVIMDVDEFLAHYGVLGMKWGQHLKDHGVKSTTRKAATTAKAAVKKDIKERTSTETTVRAKPGQLVRVVGGHGRSAHDDAIKARTAEQIAKKNTLDALSNEQLQQLVQRMNLESQYRNLAVNETRVSAGEQFATDLITKHDAKINAALAVGLGPAAPVGKMVIDGALKKATVNKGLLGGTVSEKKKNK